MRTPVTITTPRPYPRLLSPIRIGNTVVKNRFLYPNASPHFLQGPETFPAEGYRTYHASVARNGAAIITIAEWNDPDQHNGPVDLDISHMQSWDIDDPSVGNYLSLMAEDIHFYDSKLIVSARIDWPLGFSLYGGPHLGPPRLGGPPVDEPLPLERIPEVIDAFVAKIRRYRNIGYDGVTLRCDLEILPRGTRRGDAYDGATIQTRSLFLRQLYARVKEAFGPDFITEAQIAWEQPWGYGHRTPPGMCVTADEVAEFCALMDEHVDIFQIREHDATRSHPTGYNFTFGDHPAVEFAARLKREGITALLAPIGGFQEPDEMEGYLGDGSCDLFGVARAFIADPDYGAKMLAGRPEDIIPCLKCNVCHGRVVPEPDPWLSVCCVNPRFGFEHELPRLITPTSPKSVAVVGGGPAGMRAAIEAAQRGHTVTLYERSGTLGGQLAHAEHFDFKWPLRNYRDWLVRQLDQHGIPVVLNCAPTPEALQENGFDAIIAATGAAPTVPDGIAGMRDADGTVRYRTCDEMWPHEAELGHHVAIVGGSEAGVEMAIHLARTGHEVTVLTRKPEIAHDASKLHYVTMSFVKRLPDGSHVEVPEWERYDTIHPLTGARTLALEGNVVVYENADGEVVRLAADDVLVSGGHRSLIDDAMEYAASAPRFFAIGACVGAHNVQVCTRQAFARASII